ncbi:hypothetical protein EZV76_08650 [Flagellimonas alvinocaridis]|uniref:Uncharacterized protein n=1 Tax=Flagellimonas alvinocaridis TaxID=2530200 RepID=A0A4V4HX50_9FLAO|nr:hypothetical protein [Allomuricauda alvinocaridis]THV59626.1 hypothetical protein EZV76_08650 [Allomuricauda alvinocaridis]
MKKDKKNSFNTPEGYFENFNERLMGRIEKEVHSESIIPKSDGFSIPENYFDEITPKIMSKTTGEGGKVIQLKSYRTFYYGAAAVAAVFVLVFGLNWKSTTTVAFDDLANAEIDAYFESNELDINTYELAELISLDNVELNDVLEQDLDAENILEYLDETVDDIDELNLDYSDYE